MFAVIYWVRLEKAHTFQMYICNEFDKQYYMTTLGMKYLGISSFIETIAFWFPP